MAQKKNGYKLSAEMYEDLYNEFELVKFRQETYGRRLSLEAELRKVKTVIMQQEQ